MTRIRALATTAVLALGACSNPPDLSQPVDPIGDFRMGHNIVVARDTTIGPMSREATEEELEAEIRAALEERLRRYNGDGLYHVGVRVEAYVLAQPGIPLVLAPRSVLLLALNIWDNETQQKINEEPIRITAFEGANTGVPLIPSGFVKSKEEQLRNLSISAAQEIEELLRENEETWFAPKPGRARVEFSAGGSATPDPAAAEQAVPSN